MKWRHAISMNKHVIEKSLKELSDMLTDGHVDEEIKALVNSDIIKLKETLEYYQWLNRLIDTFESEEIFNFVPKNNK